MAKRQKTKPGDRLVQIDLFGNEIVAPESKDTARLVPLGFEGSSVRMIVIKGESWWVVADLARILSYRDATHASRQLRDKNKGYTPVCTLGGEQQMMIVNESGLYRLIMRSDSETAERFQDWVTEEVLPTIRRTGTYCKPLTRVDREAKRLGCDRDTAELRVKQFAMNRSTANRIFADNGSVRDLTEWHDSGHLGAFGMKAKDLRKKLGLGDRATPLDYMALVPLSINQHAKAIATKIIELTPVAPSERGRLLEKTARIVKDEALAQLGPGANFTVVDDPRRGKIIDVAVPRAIAS